ncbi:MAG: LacI family DNA-binding transcriptional regulator, partial [Phycisphaeraceae bacterium]
MTVTLKDIARDCGCCWTTVSRVLNNRAGQFSEQTRRKVLASAERLGYHRNTAARALRGMSTGRIGYIGSAPRQSALSIHLFRQLDDQVWRHGCRLLVAFNHEDPQREKACLAGLRGDGIDGLVLGPTGASIAPELEQLLKDRMPLVTISSPLTLSTPDVCIDREHGGYLLAQHLVEIGCRRPALVLSAHGRATEQKCRGLRRGFAEAGVDLDAAPQHAFGSMLTSEAPAYGAEAVRALMHRGATFDCVVTVSDDVALGVMHALREAGRSVPEQVAVVGFSDEHFAPYAAVPLTTIHTPHEQIGQAVFDLLWAQVQGGGPSVVREGSGYRRVALKPWLV